MTSRVETSLAIVTLCARTELFLNEHVSASRVLVKLTVPLLTLQ
jgi:hypothetical protein